MRIEICDETVACLIDTGSQVTVVAEHFFQKIKLHSSIKILPVHNTMVSGADGKRRQRVKYQFFSTIKIDNLLIPSVFLVIPELVYDVIIGNDWLKQNQVIISYENEAIAVKQHWIDKNNVSFDKIKSNDNADKSLELAVYENLTISEKKTTPKTTPAEKTFEEQARELVSESTGITEKERESLFSLILEYQDIFSNKLGLCRVYEHRLCINEEKVVANKTYPVPHSYRERVRDNLREMLKSGIIEKAVSPYNNPIHIVNKRDGGIRLCLDARQVNRTIIGDAERPAAIDHIMQKYAHKKYFSTFDIAQGYLQIPLEQNSRKYTAFLFEGAQYQFCRVPFGLQTAGAGFIRALRIALGDDLDEDLTTYVDDIMCATEYFDAHLNSLRRLFEKLRRAGFTLKLSKAIICKQEISFLGMIVTPSGVKPDLRKVQSILEIPEPRSRQELQKFVGVCNFYRRFSVSHSLLLEPLRELLQTNKEFTWKQTHSTAFEKIKNNFANCVALNHFHPEWRSYVQTDASIAGISAILYQKTPDEDNMIISVTSRLLTKYETNYTTTELELLAIIFALVKFHTYLYGNEFTIITDHQALTFLLKTPFQSARLTRWSLYLQQYSYKIVHCRGRDNDIADYFSRVGYTDLTKSRKALIVSQGLDRPNVGNRLSGEDFILMALRKHEPMKPLFKEIRTLQYEQRNFREIIVGLNEGIQSDTYKLYEGVLFHKNLHESEWRLAVPNELVEGLVEIVHNDGHMGAYKSTCAMKKHYFWRGMSRKIKSFVRGCDTCQRTKYLCQSMTGAYQPIVPSKPNELVCLDFYGPLPMSRGGVKYILVVLDAFSKLVVLYPVKRATAQICVLKILQNYILRAGKMTSILSDNGTQFTSKLWVQAMQNEGIRVRYSSIRHPQSDPAERTMRELSRFFRTYCADSHTKWAHYIDKVENWLNCAVHVGTGFASYELHFGKPARELIRELISFPEGIPMSHEVKIELARNRLLGAARKRSERQTGVSKVKLEVGDEVLIQAVRQSNAEDKKIAKYFHIYEGPYKIASRIGENAFELVYCDDADRKFGIYNRLNLRKYFRK